MRVLMAEGAVCFSLYAGVRRAGVHVIQEGTGRGYSVLELTRKFEQASSKAVPRGSVGRWAGDVENAWAEARMAEDLLGWHAQRDLAAMRVDAWPWQSGNPREYVQARSLTKATSAS